MSQMFRENLTSFCFFGNFDPDQIFVLLDDSSCSLYKKLFWLSDQGVQKEASGVKLLSGLENKESMYVS